MQDKSVRFIRKYALPTDYRISYELVTEEKVLANEVLTGNYCYCFNVKGFGFISARKLEPAEPNDIPAVDVLVKLKNK